MNDARRRRPIEDLLAWAWRDELPKDRAAKASRLQAPGFGHAWGSITAYGELLAMIDDGTARNGWGVVMLPEAVPGEPHPDALALAAAVLDLDALALDLPDPWEPVADLAAAGGAEVAELLPVPLARALDRIAPVGPDGARRLRLSLRDLVARHAAVGAAPVWQADVPEVLVEKGANGRPRWFVTRMVEVGQDAFGQPIYAEREFDGSGRAGRRHAPLPGAYQKRRLEPDPEDAIVCRAQWELWRAALDVLVADCAGRLVDHEALPSALPYRPWEEPIPARRILPDESRPVVPEAARKSVARHYAERGPVVARSKAGLLLRPG